MVMKVIPISSGRTPAPAFAAGTLRDTLGRSMHDLRISVTDRCNFRCVYCMPREVFDAHYTFLPHSGDPQLRGNCAAGAHLRRLGVEKIPPHRGRAAGAPRPRSPGGDAQSARVELTLTTNGSLLARNAQAWRAPGSTASRSAWTRSTRPSSAP